MLQILFIEDAANLQELKQTQDFTDDDIIQIGQW